MYARADMDIPAAVHEETTLTQMLFSWRQVFVYALIFGAAVLGLQKLLRYTAGNWVAFDCPYYWPVSIFEVRNPGIVGLVTAAVVLGVFLVAYRLLGVPGIQI